ncbi:hypothetical protein N7533_013133, partial [Penicillium manginii]|uniref:uncharacterized protein n=1 Tax=Penicillium manginii TaxID=203109 RepID=UPI002546C279
NWDVDESPFQCMRAAAAAHSLQGTTYLATNGSDRNILHELDYYGQRIRYPSYLYNNRDSIRSIVTQQLGLNSLAECDITDPGQWMCGRFNVCIPLDIHGQAGISPKRLEMLPIPETLMRKYFVKLGLTRGSRQIARILRSQIYGIGLASGTALTALDNLNFIPRSVEKLRRLVLGWFGCAIPSQYVQIKYKGPISLRTGYIPIEYIEPSRGKKLSESWGEGRHGPRLRKTLFRGLSRTLLALARTLLPKTGSFILDEKDCVKLENRPLTLQLQQLENEQIPVDIPRNTTYTSADSYIHDIISFHDSRLCHKPNSINHLEDGFYQTSALMVMRSICDQATDSISSEKYGALHKEFIEEESKEITISSPKPHSDRGTFWYSLALNSPTALFSIFYDHIQPQFSNSHGDSNFWIITMPY